MAIHVYILYIYIHVNRSNIPGSSTSSISCILFILYLNSILHHILMRVAGVKHIFIGAIMSIIVIFMACEINSLFSIRLTRFNHH